VDTAAVNRRVIEQFRARGEIEDHRPRARAGVVDAQDNCPFFAEHEAKTDRTIPVVELARADPLWSGRR
jgi:hypothetical protein